MCADPANMPFSNQKDEGFENKIANIIGQELGVPVEYTWFPQAMGFTRSTLLAKRCDLIIGTGQGNDLVLNTNALYRSAYALVYPKGKGLDGVDSIFDPRLKGKRIGVMISTPPADLVNKAGLMGKAKAYRLMVDRRYDSPAEDMIKDIRSGDIDAGVLWGPIAGYYANKGGEKLDVVPLVKDTKSGGHLEFRITMGVRQGDDLWKRQAQRRDPQAPGGHRSRASRLRRAAARRAEPADHRRRADSSPGARQPCGVSLQPSQCDRS